MCICIHDMIFMILYDIILLYYMLILFDHMTYSDTSSTAQGGGGSFKIGKL